MVIESRDSISSSHEIMPIGDETVPFFLFEMAVIGLVDPCTVRFPPLSTP